MSMRRPVLALILLLPIAALAGEEKKACASCAAKSQAPKLTSGLPDNPELVFMQLHFEQGDKPLRIAMSQGAQAKWRHKSWKGEIRAVAKRLADGTVDMTVSVPQPDGAEKIVKTGQLKKAGDMLLVEAGKDVLAGYFGESNRPLRIELSSREAMNK